MGKGNKCDVYSSDGRVSECKLPDGPWAAALLLAEPVVGNLGVAHEGARDLGLVDVVVAGQVAVARGEGQQVT